MKVRALHRYPVKGLSPEPLDAAELEAGSYFPGDRLFAVENGPSGFDPARPEHQPKIKFLTLMRNAALARLRTRYEDATATLIVEVDGGEAVRADLRTDDGRRAVRAFFDGYMTDQLRGPPELLTAPNGFRFTDSRRGFVSIINLASVAAVADMVGRPVDPLRFRGNVTVDGLAAWAELDLVGRAIRAPSGAVLRVTKRTDRCAATDVDPDTGERDMAIPATLMRRLGHRDLGVYAEVVRGGALRPGDAFTLDPEPQGSLPFA